MKFDHHHYVPCIRWKQGEYMAISRTSSMAKDSLIPLIEVPEVGFDFETRKKNKSVDEHLATFGKRVKDKWGNRSCFVDMKLIESSERMADGKHPLLFVFDEFQQAIQQVVSQDKRGLCMRFSIEEVAKQKFKSSLDRIIEKVNLEVRECDFIIDLGSPNFEPLEGFMKLLTEIIREIPYFTQWRSFTLIGTSFPSSMAEVEQGRSTIPRYEWLLYKLLVSNLTEAYIRLPTFGDYVINHPNVLSLDMRLVKPSATIRYTIDNAWLIIKGPNVRDHGLGQYQKHCYTLVRSKYYLGNGFSKGDEYIAKCALGTAKTGNLTTWRWVGTNHHLEKVVRDISSFYDSSSIP